MLHTFLVHVCRLVNGRKSSKAIIYSSLYYPSGYRVVCMRLSPLVMDQATKISMAGNEDIVHHCDACLWPDMR